MSRITLSKLAHSYLANPTSDADYALKEMDHVWQDGGAYALLGASGCGKTTLLNIISGLVRPSHGRVLFGDRDVTDAPTTERNIAQVFQFPVVYDTMTVRDNLAFPLRNRGMDAAYIAKNKKGQTVNRVENISFMGSSNILSEECWATAQFARGLGLVQLDHQARV